MDETRPPIPAEPWYVTPALARTLDALARLAHTGAFIGVVKGPSGAGKTLLLERLGALLAGDEHLAVARLDAGLAPGLLGNLASAFGLATDGNPTQTRRALIRHLTELHGKGCCPVALIDDAQRLSSLDLSLLIRLGLSADKGKSGLLNIVLAGTGELDQRIAAAGEDLSRQRVYVAGLPPLTIDESLDFLARHADPLPARLQGSAGRRAIARAGGLPGALLALLHERRRPAHGGRVAPLAAAAVLVAAVGAVLYQGYPEPTPAPAARPVTLAPAGAHSSPASAPAPILTTAPASPATQTRVAGDPAAAPAVTADRTVATPVNRSSSGHAEAAGLPTAGIAPPTGIVSSGLADSPAHDAPTRADGYAAPAPAPASALTHPGAPDDSDLPPSASRTAQAPATTGPSGTHAAADAPPEATLTTLPAGAPGTRPAPPDLAAGQTDTSPAAPATDKPEPPAPAAPLATVDPDPATGPDAASPDAAAPTAPASPASGTPIAASEPSPAVDQAGNTGTDTGDTRTGAPAPEPPPATGSGLATGPIGEPGAPDEAEATPGTDTAASAPPASGAGVGETGAAAPRADRTPPAPTPPVTTATPALKPPLPKPPLAPPARPRPVPSDDPLARAPESAWVVQLAATESEARLRAYAARNGLADIAIVRTRRDGRDWYVLLLGGFLASRDAAEATLARLPESLRVETAPWVRSVRSLRKLTPPRT